MNERPDAFDAEQLDELLSADLDGEFDAAASDLGLDPADARARADASPGVIGRRQAIAAARAALARPPLLDDVTAARLRARALAVARPAQARRPWLLAGSLAAAVGLVVAVLVAVAVNRPSSTPAQSSAIARTPASAPVGPLPGVDLGAVATVDQLGAVVRATQPPLQYQSAAPADGAARAKPVDAAENGACDGAARMGVPARTALLVRGHASVAGTPVVVLVFGGKPGPAMVVLSTDCRVLHRAVLPPKG